MVLYHFWEVKNHELDVDTYSVRVIEDDSVDWEESEMMLWSVNVSLILVVVCPRLARR